MPRNSKFSLLNSNLSPAVALAGVVFLAGVSYFRSNYTIQNSASLPKGVYRLQAAQAPFVGSTVIFCPPPAAERILQQANQRSRSTQCAGYPMLMKIALAGAGAVVERRGDELVVDGVVRGTYHDLSMDGGTKLPSWKGVVPNSHIFVWTPANHSFDSRVYGTIHQNSIINIVEQI